MTDGDHSPAFYHRLELPTHTPDDAARQQTSGELRGHPSMGSFIPNVKAYRGRLPEGTRGIEFTTAVPPDLGSARNRVDWLGQRTGVRVEGDIAKIDVVVTKNSQV